MSINVDISEQKTPTTLKDEPRIQVAPVAVEKINEFIKNKLGVNAFLRISVEGGGCNGLKYDFKPDNNFSYTDFVSYDMDKLPLVVIDTISASVLKHFIVDYENTLSRSGFIIKIPSATSRCGCGKSFSLSSEA